MFTIKLLVTVFPVKEVRTGVCVWCECVLLSVCVHAPVYMHAFVCVLVWTSKDNMNQFSFFHHLGPEDGTQIIRFGSKSYYPLCHLLIIPFLKTTIMGSTGQDIYTPLRGHSSVYYAPP